MILGVLHDDGDGRVPRPGLGQLDELVAQAREAGLVVEVETNAPSPHIPGTVDSAVYRILQESLTNVIRHAGRTRVTIALTYGADCVEVRVEDDGRRVDSGAVGAPDEGGRGIAGMRERCRLLGGDLRAGPLSEGGFAVLARIPVAPNRTASL